MARVKIPQPPTITIDVQKGVPHLWVDCELIRKFNKNTYWCGKPMEMAEAIETAFITIGIYPKMDTPDFD